MQGSIEPPEGILSLGGMTVVLNFPKPSIISPLGASNISLAERLNPGILNARFI